MVIAKIHNVFKNFTDTEQKIASYILEFPEKIVNMTAKELASACGTVPSAVNRMCKSIGVGTSSVVAVDALMLSIASLNYEDYSKHISLRNAALDGIRY